MQQRRAATYADLEALPPNMVGEILYSALDARPRPNPRHARAAGRMTAELDGPFDRGRGGPGDWLFLPEPEQHPGPHAIVPDLAGWRRARLPHLPDAAWIETPPDWAAEILSPSTQRIDRTDKLAIYAESGVGHAWYVDPVARTLEVLSLTGGKWLIAATCKDVEPVAAPPFEVHTFALDILWPLDEAAP